MMQKKKRRRAGYGLMGTPGAGPGQPHASAVHGPGRLGKAMRSLARKRTAPPTAVKQPRPRALARWANDGGEVTATVPQPKSLVKSDRNESNLMAKKSRPSMQTGKVATSNPPAFGRSTADATQQLRAKMTAKDARKKEAGLKSRRIGAVSATGKRNQGRRDSKNG